MRILILLFTCALCLQGVQAQDKNETPLIHTRGTASVYVEPDEALINFSVDTRGKDLQDARAQNERISRETITYLKAQGIEAKHIQTQRLTVGKRYDDHRRKEETRYYYASQSFDVCIKDLDKYEEIMMGLLGLEIENLGSPVFRTTRLREIKDEARVKAVIAAKEKAQLISATLEQRIGAAYEIREVSQSYNPWNNQNQNAYANTVQETAGSGSHMESGFAPGQLEIKASVDVSFRLLD